MTRAGVAAMWLAIAVSLCARSSAQHRGAAENGGGPERAAPAPGTTARPSSPTSAARLARDERIDNDASRIALRCLRAFDDHRSAACVEDERRRDPSVQPYIP